MEIDKSLVNAIADAEREWRGSHRATGQIRVLCKTLFDSEGATADELLVLIADFLGHYNYCPKKEKWVEGLRALRSSDPITGIMDKDKLHAIRCTGCGGAGTVAKTGEKGSNDQYRGLPLTEMIEKIREKVTEIECPKCEGTGKN